MKYVFLSEFINQHRIIFEQSLLILVSELRGQYYGDDEDYSNVIRMYMLSY